MLLIAALTVAVAISAGGSPDAPVPDSPAGGLALEPAPIRDPVPVAPPGGAVPPGPPGGLPDPAGPLAGLVAGMALLAARARRISAAGSVVEGALQDSLFSDVGHADLELIGHTLADLEPGETLAVVAGLSDRELGVWMREIDGRLGGLRASEQAALLAMLASRLDATQLQRLATAGERGAVISAALQEASPNTKVQLAIDLWDQMSPTDPEWPLIDQLVTSAGPAALDRASSPVVVEAVAIDLLGAHERWEGAPTRLQLESAQRVVATAAGSDDVRFKAGLFLAVTQAVVGTDHIPVVGPVSRTDLLTALGGLLRSDSRGVVGELNHRSDPHANVLSEWMRQMIEGDRHDELEVLLSDLLGPVDRLEHFTDPGTDPAAPYPNAANLGYYTGAYTVAIDAITSDAERRIELVAQLFAIVTGVIPGPASSHIGLPVGPLVDVHARSLVTGLRAEATSVKQLVWGLAKPRTADGSLWNGAGTTQFQDSWEEAALVR
ncbi:MAG: hypothetical protein KJO17_14325 [Acidimicrobiia bacterium]|nr:hypothetical protein [Acidimicrobiia bacterium]NNL71180.1 hypothetical protein [Acidimicrobiia bacterium]